MLGVNCIKYFKGMSMCVYVCKTVCIFEHVLYTVCVCLCVCLHVRVQDCVYYMYVRVCV